MPAPPAGQQPGQQVPAYRRPGRAAWHGHVWAAMKSASLREHPPHHRGGHRVRLEAVRPAAPGSVRLVRVRARITQPVPVRRPLSFSASWIRRRAASSIRPSWQKNEGGDQQVSLTAYRRAQEGLQDARERRACVAGHCLTCGQARYQRPSPQVTPKCESLTGTCPSVSAPHLR